MAKFTDAQVNAIIRGASAFRVIPFPGAPDVSVAVRCLTEMENDAARSEAHARVVKRCKPKGWDPVKYIDADPDAFQRLIERQVLWRAFFDADTIESANPEPFFPSDADVDSLTPAQVAGLTEAYLEHQDWTNPQRQLTEEEVAGLVADLGKASTAEVLLSSFAPNTLRACVISMACALRSGT